MSFGFGLGDVIAVAGLANNLRKRFVDSPDLFRAISAEVKSLSNILRDLEDVIPERDLTATQTADLKDSLEGCGNVLADLQKILDKYQDLGDANGRKGLAGKSRRLWKKLTFEPDDVKELRSRLASNIGILNIFMGGLTLEWSHIIKNGVDRLNVHQDNQHCLAIISWLSDTNFPAQQTDIFGRCQEGTGQWLLESDKYQDWHSGGEPTLFCPGIPGAGKTFITSIVINDLQQRFGQDQNTAIAYMFCNYKRGAEQTIEVLLASLLKQILQGRFDLYTEVESLYQKHSSRRTRPSIGELSEALKMISKRFSRIYIFVDALDECINPKIRSGLLENIAALDTGRNLKFFATSRFIPEILSEFDGKPFVEIRATVADVRRYLKDQITELPMCVRRSELLQEQIISDITDAVDGMFLLAKLHLGSLSGKTTVKAVRVMLQQLPKGSEALGIAYNEALERIGSQGPDLQQLAKQTISWVVCAARQLSSLELRYALAVEDGVNELDQDNVPDIDDIISVCAGLVTVDEDSDIIRLVHYTTQEFFERTIPTWVPHAGVMILGTCLNSLSFHSIVECSWLQGSFTGGISVEKLQKLFHKHVFLQYAFKHWHFHAGSCGDKSIKRTVLSFLEKERGLGVYWKMSESMYFDDELPYLIDSVPDKMGAMHFAAYFGLVEVTFVLLESGQKLSIEDNQRRNPLHYAIWGGHHAMSELFLAVEGKDPNIVDVVANTSLQIAVRSGMEIALTLLLEYRDTIADQQDIDGYTPLLSASLFGRGEFVKSLLKRSNVNVNCGNKNGATPLHQAARHGRVAVVKLLLQHGMIKINQPDVMGRTPLYFACEGRYKSDVEATIKLLLDRKDIDVNFSTCDLRTPLHNAAGRGGYDVAKLLLQTDNIKVNLRDYRGNTALALAAYYGKKDIVKLLLPRDDVDINCRGEKNRTALMSAYQEKREAIVNMLEEAGGQGEIPVFELRDYSNRQYVWNSDDSESFPGGETDSEFTSSDEDTLAVR